MVNILLYFILGILTAEFILPLLEGVLTLWLSALEAKKATYGEEINNANIRIQ